MCRPRPRNWGFGGRHASFDGVCPPKWRFRGQTMAIKWVYPPSECFCGQTIRTTSFC